MMIVTVTAAFKPDAKSLVQMTERSMTAARMTATQTVNVVPCPLTQPAILSWLKATRMNGMETAPETLTIARLVTVTDTDCPRISGMGEALTHVSEHIVHWKLPVVVPRECIDVDCKECSHK